SPADGDRAGVQATNTDLLVEVTPDLRRRVESREIATPELTFGVATPAEQALRQINAARMRLAGGDVLQEQLDLAVHHRVTDQRISDGGGRNHLGRSGGST